MSIYIDVSAAVHARAGLGRYAESLACALAALLPTRCALFYNAGLHKSCLPPALNGLPSRRVYAGYKPWRMAVWLGHLLGFHFDPLLPDAELFHATEHLLLPLQRIPTVLTVHDLIFRLFPEHHKRLNFWYLNATMPLYCRRAYAIIAVSEATKRDLMRLYAVPTEKITVIHEAAAPHFKPATAEQIAHVRERYGLPEHYILRVGTIEPRKNLERLLDALQVLQRSDPTIRLVVVGSKGWLYERFFKKLHQSELRYAVILTGHIRDADLPAIYSGATLLVEPSLYEGFGLPLLEAMACGTPVVCSNTSSLPEVGGDAAYYFDPRDSAAMAEAIGEVWRDSDLRETMRQNGLMRAAQFSWESAAQKTLAVYRSLVPNLL
ncbi:MAG: glycosyltransferase family 1 protein [Ardenticatenia bacterium]|nr:MAG: glycosyltransferase family 1 protein [Ardenticatenia bacterium]